MSCLSFSSLDDELWRRAQERREAELASGSKEVDRMLLPLALSLARLAAQRDAKAAPQNVE